MKKIDATGPVRAHVAAPPSKSLTARALLLAAMTSGETTISDLLDSDDSRIMFEAIRKIGFDVRGSFREGITIGERISMSAGEVEIFVGNTGTAMRFLTGFLAFTPGRFILKGDKRMHERPIGALVDALRAIDSEVEYLEREGFPPLIIRGKRMRGGHRVSVDASASSQFVSALVLGGTTLPGGLTIEISGDSSRPYIDLTAAIVRDFGGSVYIDDSVVTVHGSELQRSEYRVEGDYSSASYWFAAAAATGGEVSVSNLSRNSAQGDRAFVEVLETMGARVSWGEGGVTVAGPPRLSGGTFHMRAIPDVVPTLAAIAPLASAPIEIRGVAHLRHKESDRIAVVARELRKLGATVDELEDGLRIEPGWSSGEATIAPEGDHRIAMSFAIAGLARGAVTIADPQVVSKSYPRFWRTLDEVIAGNAS